MMRDGGGDLLLFLALCQVAGVVMRCCGCCGLLEVGCCCPLCIVGMWL